MINGMHALLYSRDVAAARAFLGDVLGLASIDIGRGWLIFAAPPVELAVHPLEAGDADRPPDTVELYLMCDDLARTISELEAKGVEITRPVEERRYGLFTALRVPGGNELGLYEPRHATALALTTRQVR
ncbi:MAG TPA: VOC family protein [Gemmatimonadaceae bacterium]|nr:VOC family protein [Gemmatimonadaceae bacterium]